MGLRGRFNGLEVAEERHERKVSGNGEVTGLINGVVGKGKTR